MLYHNGEELIRRIVDANATTRDGWRAQASAYQALYATSLPEAAMVQFIRVFQPESPDRKRRRGCDAPVPPDDQSPRAV